MKMRVSDVLVLAIAAFALAGCSTGESFSRAGYDFTALDKVAVVDVIGAVSGEGEKNQIGDFFVMQLLKKGYTPIERSQVQSLLKEHEFQASDITTSEGVAKAGRILNVPAVLVVNIPNFDEEMSITAKLIDVEDGSILWLGSGTGKTGRFLSTVAGAAAGAGAGAAVAGEGNETTGVIVGGVLGGVAGQALSPQKATRVKEVIEKICKSMPSRIPQAPKKFLGLF